jgi:hypothetical protein
MQTLVLHPDSASGSVHTITASIDPMPRGCRATFIAIGDIRRIAMPVRAKPGRFDDLWRTTCFEIFWQPEGRASYREFNLSPSTRWACYDFDDFRAGVRNAPADVTITVSVSDDRLELTADIISDLPLPAKVALNAIVEDADGVGRFWALAFAAGAPEFHSAICRALPLDDAR